MLLGKRPSHQPDHSRHHWELQSLQSLFFERREIKRAEIHMKGCRLVSFDDIFPFTTEVPQCSPKFRAPLVLVTLWTSARKDSALASFHPTCAFFLPFEMTVSSLLPIFSHMAFSHAFISLLPAWSASRRLSSNSWALFSLCFSPSHWSWWRKKSELSATKWHSSWGPPAHLLPSSKVMEWSGNVRTCEIW